MIHRTITIIITRIIIIIRADKAIDINYFYKFLLEIITCGISEFDNYTLYISNDKFIILIRIKS